MNPLPAQERDESLWQRLRTSMDRLAAQSERNTNPALLAAKLAARAKQLRGRLIASGPAEEPLVYVAFRKGNERFGIPVADVIEVQPLDSFCPVPGTPSFLPGVIHWRGEVLSLLDLGSLFGIPESGLADVHVCLIVEAGNKRVAVVALEIEEIHAVPQSELKPVPELPGDLPAEWLLGIHDHNRMILQMNVLLGDTRLTQWRDRPAGSTA